MSNNELDMIIDWCREKIAYTKSMRRMNSKTFDGYETAMKAVMSYLHSLKKANNAQIQATTSEIIELANIIAERPCDSEDCAPCIRTGRRCNDYLKAERAIEAGYRKQSEAQRQIPCEIGDKIYEVTGKPGERIGIDEHTVSEVGLNGVFARGGYPCYRPHRHYFAYADEGVWWFFSKEDAEAEKKRMDDP